MIRGAAYNEGTVGVGIIVAESTVAIYVDHEFECSFTPDVARSVARRMLEMADLIDPPKKEKP